MACCSFVVQGSLVNPIAAAFLGDGLRSREMRTSEERKVLDLRMQGVVYVVRYIEERGRIVKKTREGYQDRQMPHTQSQDTTNGRFPRPVP